MSINCVTVYKYVCMVLEKWSESLLVASANVESILSAFWAVLKSELIFPIRSLGNGVFYYMKNFSAQNKPPSIATSLLQVGYNLCVFTCVLDAKVEMEDGLFKIKIRRVPVSNMIYLLTSALHIDMSQLLHASCSYVPGGPKKSTPL